ncbi:MAG: hypothetical protein AB7S75_19845 [Desulfococcaceae bacterium]
MPIVVINDSKLSKLLNEKGWRVFDLTADEKDIFGFQEAIRDIGLKLPTACGEVYLEEKGTFNDEERKVFCDLIQAYKNELDCKECAKFESKLREFGDISIWCNRIVTAENIKRMIADDIQIDMEIPYFDGKHFFVSKNDTPETALAHILSYFDFVGRFKNAINDINQLKKDLSSRHKEDSEESETPKNTGERIENVRKKHSESLTDKRDAPKPEKDEEWKTGFTPEEEENVRRQFGNNIIDSLKKGPELYKERVRKRIPEKSEKYRTVDPNAVDPKSFLLEEYKGKCQLCATELLLSTGKKWIETFHIVETKDAWWADRPFNILGLCPNCHALAKHGGGRDLANIQKAAKCLVKIKLTHYNFSI